MSARDPDPVPTDVVRSARAAFDSERPHYLAVLVYDSLVDADESPQKHILRFEHERVGLQVHVSSESTKTLIQGMVDNGVVTQATLHFQGLDTAMVLRMEGATFDFSPVGHGLVRVELETGGESPVWTDWFRI